MAPQLRFYLAPGRRCAPERLRQPRPVARLPQALHSSIMTYATIRFEVADQVATLTLNRPDKLNSFTAEMHAELKDALGRVTGADSGVRALLITGAGRGFCAGQDLSQRSGPVV